MLIIPTYNERQNIRELVKRIRKSAGDIPILFVDDNSPDGTAEEIRRLQRSDKHIFLRVRAHKSGLGPAYRDALGYVIRNNLADYIVTMDADLSHPPEILPQIVSLLGKYDVVVASRYMAGGGASNWNVFRKMLSRLGNFYARFMTGVPISDLTAGMVGYKVSSLKKINFSEMVTDGYAFQIEMKFLLHQFGFSMGEYPIVFEERQGGKSKLSSAVVFEGLKFPLKIFFRRIKDKLK